MTRTRPRALLAVLVLLAIGAVAFTLWDVATTRSHLTRGRAALDADDPAAALPHLEHVLARHPTNTEAQFLAARATRQTGDTAAAGRHLDAAARLGWPAEAVAVERALIALQLGDPAAVEPLARLVAAGHPESAAVLPVLVPAVLGQFRVVEADGLTERWVGLRPDHPPAWAARADVLERLRRKDESLVAWREAVRLAPADRAARLRLARLLVETKQPPAEAVGHLEALRAESPADAEVAALLAEGRLAEGRPDAAAALLDPLADHPKALHLRGRIELDRGRPADALPFLRRSAALDRSDPEALYSLFVALQQAGRADEAAAAEGRWKRCVADLARVRELGKVVAAEPADPDPRREIGELFLRHGRDADGVRWLESALRARPDHPPTHRLLADYYERTGDLGRAVRHRAAGGDG